MERYRLNWTPGVGPVQDVRAAISGGPAASLGTFGDTNGSLEVDLPTGATVEWFIQTKNSDGSEFVDSDHVTFTALDQTPVQIAPATGLTQEWLGHTP